jgi:membrane fusion protein (multidrug efflux system)
MVTLRLDAHPDLGYQGTVQSISRTVQEKSWRDPLKVVNLTLSLDETDPERMRPGMRFRGEIEIGRLDDVTLLPIRAVFHDEGSVVAYRHRLTGWQRVKLVLGDRNADQVEVLDGLEPGDTVSLERRP